MSESQSNNTEFNNTDFSDTESNQFSSKPIRVYREEVSVPESMRSEPMDITQQYRRLLEENISLDILKERYPHDADFLDELVDIMLDVVCSSKDRILVGREQKSINLVKSQFLKLNSSHIEYILECLKKNITKVTNIRQYLITVLYNAPMTMNAYYDAEVKHDMAHGLI